jgi:hypothetical protein|tara:strand:+ start:774 stop:1097 length:324 start_codon:yes stop_codon:yes gene_type:complete
MAASIPILTIREVVGAWIAGESARTKNGSMSTDGETLKSYDLEIGTRSYHGRPIVKDYRSPNFVSQTTSTHVGLAIQAVNDPGSVYSPYPPMVGVARRDRDHNTKGF